MRFVCTLSPLGHDQWLIRHSGPDVGTVELTAESREEALEKMRREIQYRLELCPCTGELYQYIDVELVENRPA